MNKLYDFLKSKEIISAMNSGRILDIGSGDGREGLPFEEAGFHVTSIDIKNGIDAKTYEYPKDEYDIVIAKNSLPFMSDSQFNVISNAYSTLKPGGFFYGTVFGKDEPWAKLGIITPLDFSETLDFITHLGFDVIWKCEEKGIGKTMKGEMKDWHILKFLVKKQTK